MQCENKSGKIYEYGCLMIYVDIPKWSNFTDYVSVDDLYLPENERYGIEQDPHITILYGIHDDVHDNQIMSLFSNIKSSDIQMDVDGIDCFNNEDYDVLKMNIKSDKLNDLNKLAKSLEHTCTFPSYKPHLTIAYLRKNMGSKYEDKNFVIKIDNINKIVYSKTNGEKIDLPLE